MNDEMNTTPADDQATPAVSADAGMDAEVTAEEAKAKAETPVVEAKETEGVSEEGSDGAPTA